MKLFSTPKAKFLIALFILPFSVLSQEKESIQSMGSLEFSPEGILFVGDSRGWSSFMPLN